MDINTLLTGAFVIGGVIGYILSYELPYTQQLGAIFGCAAVSWLSVCGISIYLGNLKMHRTFGEKVIFLLISFIGGFSLYLFLNE